MNKKAFFTAFGLFLMAMLTGFAVGAWYIINKILSYR